MSLPHARSVRQDQEIVKRITVDEDVIGFLGNEDKTKLLLIPSEAEGGNDMHLIPLSFYVYDPDTRQMPASALNFSIVDFDDMTDGYEVDIMDILSVEPTTGQLKVNKMGLNAERIPGLRFSVTGTFWVLLSHFALFSVTRIRSLIRPHACLFMQCA
jgi:hypothetical protein